MTPQSSIETREGYCPFYGMSLHSVPARDGEMFAMLYPSKGNRCALVTDAHSPCIMEVYEGAPCDWSKCRRNPSTNALDPAMLQRSAFRA